MSTNPIKTFNKDITKLHQAQEAEAKAKTAEAKARTAEKTATTTERTALANISAQATAITDAFETGGSTMTPAQQQVLLGQMYSLGEKQVETRDTFSTQLSDDKKGIAKDAKTVATDKRDVNQAYAQAKGALRPAEYDSSLVQTNRERKEVGLNAVSKVIRPPADTGLAKAVTIAREAVNLERSEGCYDYSENYGERTNYGAGPLTKQGDGRITFDCSGFVGAVYRDAGLPPPYTVGYAGTSYDVAGNPRMQQVSESQAKPGDVVVFPDHIALYIGGGECISMGQEGDPAIVSVAAEAAYNNRGIQGFYHLKGT